MAAIFQVNQDDVAWHEYTSDRGPEAIRYKAITAGVRDVPPVQFLEYGPGHTDPVHQHDVGEFFIVTSGELWLDESCTRAGGVVFIPPGVDYAVRAGDQGVQYFRVVVR
jgi:mannose-6-phosphate isomerase-like protein (cupin superfamily)